MIVGEYCKHKTELGATVDRSHLIDTSPEGPEIVALADWLELSEEKRTHVPTPRLMIESAQARLSIEDDALHAERLAAWQKLHDNTFAMEPTVPAYTDVKAFERAEVAPTQSLPLTTEETFQAIVEAIKDERDQRDYYVDGNLPLVAESAPEVAVKSVFDQVRDVLGPAPVATMVEMFEPKVPEHAYLSAYREAA